MCRRRFRMVVELYSQWSQLNGLSPVWIRICFLISYLYLGRYPHTLHCSIFLKLDRFKVFFVLAILSIACALEHGSVTVAADITFWLLIRLGFLRFDPRIAPSVNEFTARTCSIWIVDVLSPLSDSCFTWPWFGPIFFLIGPSANLSLMCLTLATGAPISSLFLVSSLLESLISMTLSIFFACAVSILPALGYWNRWRKTIEEKIRSF